MDDNFDILGLIQMTVESMGHEFESAPGGREGLELIRTNKYDMVFLDLSMPDFSGLDVIDVLAKEETIKNQHVILFTASFLGVGEFEKDVLAKGVHSVLTKPADIEQILDKISEVEKLVSG